MIRYTRDILAVLATPCSKQVELMSRAMDLPPTRGERHGLRLHRAICTGCRRYHAHLETLAAAARSLHESSPLPAQGAQGMPQDVRSRLLDALKTSEKNS